MTNHKGIFITFEGGDGCGKSTHVRLLAERLQKQGREVLVPREPGSTPIGEKIREILLDKNNAEMTSEAELLLYEAARAQIVAEVIRPAIDQGKIVLCDRFFDSSTAYQGFGRQMDVDTIKKINMFATNGLAPERTLLFQRETAEEGLAAAAQEASPDRLELAGEDFHKRVRDGFAQLAATDKIRWRIINIGPDLDKNAEAVYNSIKDLL